MDCRRALGPLALLLGSVAGCTPNPLFPLALPLDKGLAKAANSSDIPGVTPIPTEPPFREPVKEVKPLTWVALGDFREQLAVEKARTPEERKRIGDEARKAYENALSLDKTCLPAHLGLARHWEANDRHDRALACYDEALRLNAKTAALWFEAGMCQARHKEWDGALERLRRATELESENRQYGSSYAVCLASAERFDESLSCLKKSYSEAEAHFNLARTLHRMNRPDLCRQHLAQALLLDPKLKAAQELLTEVDRSTADKGVASKE